MSASLVGSEMCIRDRRCVGGGSSLLPAALDQPLASDARTALILKRETPCLLYTSDAADDM
eukprot:1538725-Alexandrium_andersonii.AAC.1